MSSISYVLITLLLLASATIIAGARLSWRMRLLQKGAQALDARLRRLESRDTALSTIIHRIDAPRESPIMISIPRLPIDSASIDTAGVSRMETRFGAIWSMSERGSSSFEIAREIGLPDGEVELILGLRGLIRPKQSDEGVAK